MYGSYAPCNLVPSLVAMCVPLQGRGRGTNPRPDRTCGGSFGYAQGLGCRV